MENRMTISLPASVDALPGVLEETAELLRRGGCPEDEAVLLCVAVEEIFVNIAHYAYNGNPGEACVTMSAEGGEFVAELSDGGVAYDPLTRPDPDLTLDAEERDVGGLGIYMVRQYMDQVSYSREGGRNRLTMRRKFATTRGEGGFDCEEN